jgi:hypothetical protein
MQIVVRHRRTASTGRAHSVLHTCIPSRAEKNIYDQRQTQCPPSTRGAAKSIRDAAPWHMPCTLAVMPLESFSLALGVGGTPATTSRFSRSRQMCDCLRKEFLYSEKRARDVLFRAIEEIVEERSRDGRSPQMLSRLTREAVARARQQAEAAGFEFGHWETAGKAVIKAMLSAGTLLTPDGEPIAPGITAQATPVGALTDRCRDVTEAFLLQVLIERLGDVTTRDHTALAHALFRQFDRAVPLEDLEDRVVILLARLADEVELAGDVYSLRTRRPAWAASPRRREVAGRETRL